MSAAKKVSIGIGTVAGLLCLAIIFWWVYVYLFAPTKIASFSLNVDKQTISSEDAFGETSVVEKPLIEVNIYDNLYEIILNSIWDERQDKFLSYCFQFYSNNETLNMTRTYYDQIRVDKYFKEVTTHRSEAGILSGLFYNVRRHRNIVMGNPILNNVSVFAYEGVTNSGSEMDWYSVDYKDLISNFMAKDSFLTIQLTNADNSKSLYGIQPKNDDIEFDTNNEFFIDTYETLGDFSNNGFYHDFYVNYRYFACDIVYILSRIYANCVGLESGTDADKLLIFGDYFNYKIFKDGAYVDLLPSDDRYSKIDITAKSLINAHIKRTEGLCVSANNSLIGWLKGTENYGVTSENTFSYSTSAGTINVIEDDLVINRVDDTYTLVLSDEFIKYYSKYVGKVRLNIVIDLGKFQEFKNLTISTGDFFVYKLNGQELNIRLDKYSLGVV